jgi:hypothetical protein
MSSGVIRHDGRGCGKLSTTWLSGRARRGFTAKFWFIWGISGFFRLPGPVSGGFVGLQGSNEVETVLFPVLAVDQAVVVEPVVAVKVGNEGAGHFFLA